MIVYKNTSWSCLEEKLIKSEFEASNVSFSEQKINNFLQICSRVTVCFKESDFKRFSFLPFI